MHWPANKPHFLGIIAVLFLIFGSSKLTEPRGIRNNNPGNIRGNNDRWLGAFGIDNAGFVQFSDPVYGLRAMARIIGNYQRIHYLVTITQIIHRWAPTSENDTQSYIDSVASRSGIDANAFIEPDDLPALMAAMIYHENGKQPYAMTLIEEGISLA